jgi:hypothetical protein
MDKVPKLRDKTEINAFFNLLANFSVDLHIRHFRYDIRLQNMVCEDSECIDCQRRPRVQVRL